MLIGAAGYLAYDDYYKQRPALQQAQAEIQQLQQLQRTPVRPNVSTPISPTPPAWFQKRLQDGSSLDSAHQHQQKEERPQNATGRP
jgi:hypothetical protein